MNRRGLLAATGMAAAAALAGCTEGAPRNTTDNPPNTTDEPPVDEPTGSLPEGSPSSTNERMAELVAGNAGFALDLHEQLTAADDVDNVFVSPYSISMALAMTYGGASGQTETAMRETLGFSLSDETHPAFDELQAALDARATSDVPGDPGKDTTDAFQLEVANALWGASDYSFAEAYLDLVDEHYGGGFNEADFGSDPEAERERINQWVDDETGGRIEELIPKDGLSAQTVLVLTNAIYFMAGWQLPFDPDETSGSTFRALDGSESTVSMMHQNLRADYADLPGVQAIELPYVGGEVSMVVIVPDEGEFEEIHGELSGATLFGIFEALGDASGDLRMPRFEYEFETELSQALKTMGMESAFGPGADFAGMVTSGGGPGIDDVFHKSFVRVDEEGTEAAAATGVVMNESASERSFDLTVDRPFLFCIRDRPTDAVLFLGQVTNVSAVQS
ncbi:serpin family protein [Halohasta salina]|uniref:serpin family protein n=1 Tax=Halohasta salina TaxID=2961621 RepID=UPI0020A4CACA|nr:serpin family protein [Halohasta salina]